MSTAQVDVEATNRLAGFNAERDQILGRVQDRIIAAYLARADRMGDDSLEYILNDVAFSEIRRLEASVKGGGRVSSNHNARLARWRNLSHRLLRMSDADKRAELESLTQYYCRDIVGNFNPRVFRFASGLVPPAISFLLSPISTWREGVAALTEVGRKVHVQGPLATLRRLAGQGTLVVTPTHSSNLDSIVLALALVLAGLPPATYGAGKNLFTNPFISYFMRNLGAYRVDRRLRFRLYKDVLKEYSTVLLERGYHSLFFPGGTRSRSNRIEDRLKLGLLGTAVTAYRNNVAGGAADRRIYVAPVTINYRLVLEAETLIEDHLAEEGKSRYIIDDDEFSRLGRIVEFARKILVHDGAVILRFGTPLDPFGNQVDESGESRDRRGRRIDPASYVSGPDGEACVDDQRDAQYTRTLGAALARGYRESSVYMATHVVARALFDELAGRAGTRDVYRLLRASDASACVPVPRVVARVDALRRTIAENPELGVLADTLAAQTPEAVVDDALVGLATYHTRPVAFRRGDEVQVESVKLLFYYQNRLSHVPEPGRSIRSDREPVAPAPAGDAG